MRRAADFPYIVRDTRHPMRSLPATGWGATLLHWTQRPSVGISRSAKAAAHVAALALQKEFPMRRAVAVLIRRDRQRPVQSFDTQSNPPAAWCDRGISSDFEGCYSSVTFCLSPVTRSTIPSMSAVSMTLIM